MAELEKTRMIDPQGKEQEVRMNEPGIARLLAAGWRKATVKRTTAMSAADMQTKKSDDKLTAT